MNVISSIIFSWSPDFRHFVTTVQKFKDTIKLVAEMLLSIILSIDWTFPYQWDGLGSYLGSRKNPKSSSLQFHRTSCVHYLCVSISWYQPLIPASVKITFSRTVNMRAPSDNRLFSMFSKSDFFSSTIFKAKGYPPTAKQMLIVSLMQIHLQSKEDFSLQRILYLH